MSLYVYCTNVVISVPTNSLEHISKQLTYNCKHDGIAHFEILLGKLSVVEVRNSGSYAQICITK